MSQKKKTHWLQFSPKSITLTLDFHIFKEYQSTLHRYDPEPGLLLSGRFGSPLMDDQHSRASSAKFSPQCITSSPVCFAYTHKMPIFIRICVNTHTGPGENVPEHLSLSSPVCLHALFTILFFLFFQDKHTIMVLNLKINTCHINTPK